MPCYHPVKAYRSRELNRETGRYGITFNPINALVEGSHIMLPCGRCTGCRLDRSRQWAVRCMHEAQLWDANSYLTLTFSNQHLPANYSVDVRDTQKFMKRLRKSLGSKPIRFLASGEYGDQFQRPHYHLIIFNHAYDDLKLHSKNRRGEPLYSSEKLRAIWPYGDSTVGAVTFDSAAYVARYCMKKINGDKADAYYTRLHPLSGVTCHVTPEFMVSSRRPGLGAMWLDRFKTDVYPSDFVLSNGRKSKPPRFYDDRLTDQEIEEVKRRRKATGLRFRVDQTPERRAVREEVLNAKLALWKRNLKDH